MAYPLCARGSIFRRMIGALILGFVAGMIGRMLMPGDVFRHMSGPKSWGISLLIGLIGASVGWLIFTGLLGIGDDDVFDLGGILSAIIGVLIVLPIAGFVLRRVGASPSAARWTRRAPDSAVPRRRRGHHLDEVARGVARERPRRTPGVRARAQLEPALAQGGQGRLVVVDHDRGVAVDRRVRVLERHQVDLRALALHPDEALRELAGRRDLLEAQQPPERDAGVHLVGPDLDRDVLEHVRTLRAYGRVRGAWAAAGRIRSRCSPNSGRRTPARCSQGDEIAAELTVREAIDARLTTAQIDDEIIAPALWLVGRLWARGEISIADEHLATNISLRVLALQREATRTVRGRRGSTALLAAPEGEMHTVALQMIANLLRDAGYTVLMLGPDVPLDALAESAARHEPQVVCMTATMPDASDRLMLADPRDRARAGRGRGTCSAAAGSRRACARMPGIHVCKRVSDAVDAADALVKRAELN